VSGALKRNYLAQRVNPDRKSGVLQQTGGSDLRLTSSFYKTVQSRESKQDSVLQAARAVELLVVVLVML
jgi:hypothetical protein